MYTSSIAAQYLIYTPCRVTTIARIVDIRRRPTKHSTCKSFGTGKGISAGLASVKKSFIIPAYRSGDDIAYTARDG